MSDLANAARNRTPRICGHCQLSVSGLVSEILSLASDLIGASVAESDKSADFGERRLL